MRGSMRFCAILAVGLLAIGSRAYSQEVAWVAIGADGPFSTAVPNAVGEDTRIVLDAGVAYRIEFEFRMNGWGNAPGAPTLGSWRAPRRKVMIGTIARTRREA